MNNARYLFFGKGSNVLLLLTMLLGITCSTPSFAVGDKVRDYIRLYGTITPSENSRVAKAQQVFQRVRDVANKHSKFLQPQLFVLNNKKRGRQYWAKALPDGNVVLWKAAIDACYQNAKLAGETEARLAFILGHELGHLSHDDYGFLKRSATGIAGRKDLELRADKEGYTYASLSGYRVGLLLANRFNNQNFLANFLAKTRSNFDYHPVTISVTALQEYLTQVQNKLAFFDFGVRLSHFERCDDGEYFLQEFYKVFPAREVLNNLGFCYLQLARQEMQEERAYFYWMPQILDVETQATGVVMGGTSSKTLKQMASSSQARRELNQAKAVLEQAARADLSYLPARFNLAVTYLYLGQATDARQILKEAYQLASDNLEIQALQALAIYEENGDVKRGQRYWTIARLQELAQQPKVPLSVLFNLAHLLEIGEHSAEARPYWNRLARSANQLPKPIREIVCHRQNVTQHCGRSIAHKTKPLPWKWPLAFGWQLEPTKAMNKLNAWGTPLYKKWGHLEIRIYQSPNREIEVLKMNDTVQMQVLKGDNLGTINELSSYCGQALRQRTLATGVLKSCGEWTALVFEDKVREVWRMLR